MAKKLKPLDQRKVIRSKDACYVTVVFEMLGRPPELPVDVASHPWGHYVLKVFDGNTIREFPLQGAWPHEHTVALQRQITQIPSHLRTEIGKAEDVARARIRLK